MSKGPRAKREPAPTSQRRTYSIEFLNVAANEFAELDAKTQKRVGARIDALSNNPRPDGCSKLRGARTRTGFEWVTTASYTTSRTGGSS